MQKAFESFPGVPYQENTWPGLVSTVRMLFCILGRRVEVGRVVTRDVSSYNPVDNDMLKRLKTVRDGALIKADTGTPSRNAGTVSLNAWLLIALHSISTAFRKRGDSKKKRGVHTTADTGLLMMLFALEGCR